MSGVCEIFLFINLVNGLLLNKGWVLNWCVIILMYSVICLLGLGCPDSLQLNILRKILKANLIFFYCLWFMFLNSSLYLKLFTLEVTVDITLTHLIHSLSTLSINLHENGIYITWRPYPKENTSIFWSMVFGTVNFYLISKLFGQVVNLTPLFAQRPHKIKLWLLLFFDTCVIKINNY